MQVKICSGYPLSTQKGNSVTAKRLARLLSSQGLNAEAVHLERVQDADAIVTLNAIKTASLILDYAEVVPQGKILVMLTGTDIHQGIHEQKQLAARVFEVADALVVAHAECIHEIPEHWRAKVRVIYPSVEIPEELPIKEFDVPTITCLGHMRHVKNSHQLYRAMALLPNLQIQGISLGAALEPEEALIASRHVQSDVRYKWIDGLEREQALEYMKGSLVTVNTSFLEGGANSVAEAIVMQVPILASRIDGNVGLLGSDYLGLYEVGNDQVLASLIQQAVKDSEYRSKLKQQLNQRSKLFSTKREGNDWGELVKSLLV